MKRLLFSMQPILLTVTIIFCASCNKQDNREAGEKTIIGLTKEEIKELESVNPSLRIDLSNPLTSDKQFFTSKQDAQDYIDSLKKLYNSYLDTNKRAINVTHLLPAENSLIAPAPCGAGVYTANAGSAGIFSSFSITFQFGAGGVSNANVSLTGLHFFSWGNQSSFYSGNNGCTQGDATFGVGSLSWTVVYHINWSFNPSTCMFYFTQGSGGCGAGIPTSL